MRLDLTKPLQRHLDCFNEPLYLEGDGIEPTIFGIRDFGNSPEASKPESFENAIK